MWILIGGVIAPLVAMGILYAIKKKLWKGALVMSGSLGALLLVHLQHDTRLTDGFIMGLVVVLTWVSGLDYLVGGVRKLRARKDFGRADGVRVLGAIGMPILIFTVLAKTPATPWPLLTVLATELSVGGLDNLLSHHQKASGALAWGARVGGVCALLGAALLLPAQATWFCVVAAALSTTGVAWEFWRGRSYYLDAKLRDQAPRGAILTTQSSG